MCDRNICAVFSEVKVLPELAACVIKEIKVDTDGRAISCLIYSETVPDAETVNSLRASLIKAYRLNTLSLCFEFSSEAALANFDNYRKYIESELFDETPIYKYIFQGSIWKNEDNLLEITLRHGFEEYVADNKTAQKIELFMKRSGVSLSVHFASDLEQLPEPELAPVYAPSAARQDTVEKPLYLLGRLIEGETMPVSEVRPDSGRVIIEGDIFFIDTREIGKGKVLVTFYVSDSSGAVICKFFSPVEKFDNIKDDFKKGIFVRVRGDAEFDRFEQDLTVSARDINLLERKKKRDNSTVKRVELHAHTQMSSMDGMASASDLVKLAKQYGHTAVAITDHGVVQAFPDAFHEKDDTIKILYGTEAYLVNDCNADTPNIASLKSHHAVIFAKNLTGLKNLYKLISMSHLKYYKRNPRIPKSEFLKHRDGLLIGSACEAGELYRALLNGAPESEIDALCEFYDYYEIQPIGNNMFLVREGTVGSEKELQDINKRICELGDRFGKPVVATGDVHFLNPQDEVFRRILMASKGFTDADYQAPLYFRTTAEMLHEFEYLGADLANRVVVENTNKIADMIEDIRPVPKEKCPPEIEGSAEDIERMCREKATSVYGDPLPEIVESRMKKELESIIKHGFAVMYMIAHKLVKKSLDDGYLVGSRGSVGSSFVAYLTDITEVNALAPHYVCPKCKYSEFITDGSVGSGCDMPDRDCPKCGTPFKKDGYDIPFETFLGFNGDKAPDIDLNFSGDYQPIAHKYTETLFGEGYVFRAGTIGTVADKTAYGFVRHYYDEHGKTVSRAETARLVDGCTGVKRTTGQHPGGVIVLPKGHDIHEFTPVQHPADKDCSDIITTHFDYHSIDQNLLKLDLLGHDDPTVIRMLEDLTGVDAKKIPLDDKDTMSLFLSTEVLGVSREDINSEVGTYAVPEFGTRFVRQMLVDTKPTTFSDLIRISGLSHGTDVWTNNAQDLVKSGTCTLASCICTRDDIMIFLIHKGLPPSDAFKIMESVRKGRGLKDEWEALMRQHSVPEWYIASCKKIKYMFPKAHAAAYVTMAFRIAWFKVHYPLQFYLAYFSVRADSFEYDLMCHGKDKILTAISDIESRGRDASAKEKSMVSVLEVCVEMYARGISFCPIDLYKSHAKNFIEENGMIRPPLNSLPGVGTSAAESIASERENGAFIAVDDMIVRTGITRAVVETLRAAGCLDGLDESSQLSMF